MLGKTKYDFNLVDLVMNPNFRVDRSSSDKNICICVIGEEQSGKSTLINGATGVPFKVSKYIGNKTTEGLIYGVTHFGDYIIHIFDSEGLNS